jgi:membrane protein implicated in regulation of membrane protease activity
MKTLKYLAEERGDEGGWFLYEGMPEDPPEPVACEDRHLEVLLGREGITRSSLRPMGDIVLDGSRYEARASAGVICTGQAVRVTQVERGILVVAPAGE